MEVEIRYDVESMEESERDESYSTISTYFTLDA